MDFGYLDDPLYNEMDKAESKLYLLEELKDNLCDTNYEHAERMFYTLRSGDLYDVKEYADNYLKYLTDKYIQPDFSSCIRKEIEASIKEITFDFDDNKYRIFEHNKRIMNTFYNSLENKDIITFESSDCSTYIKAIPEKDNDKKIVTAIHLNNKKYSYGIFYEKMLPDLCYWYLNEDSYWERIQFHEFNLKYISIWKADTKGDIYYNTIGKTKSYNLT